MDTERYTRRSLLAALSVGAGAALAGCFGDSEPQSTAEPVGDEEALRLAEAYAPDVYFEAAETWFPTDPREYTSEVDGETVVTGFDAVEGYLQAYEDAGGTPPDPTVFYNVLRYGDGPLAVVQYWFYSAFDQFTTNFHWHDWELLHVFVDVDAGEPQLYVASAHSRKVPNNEHLDPEGTPNLLSELGSHSSGLSLNDQPSSFQRFALGDSIADVTNEAIGVLEALSEFPLAYGLPRDEGARLPYVVPELDGEPVYDHAAVPTFEREHLAPAELTIRDLTSLSDPPRDLPTRETGTMLAHEDGDVAYELVPTADVEDVSAFTGPQLSFEFAVPEFLEDAVSSHITTAGVPWDQERYRNPLVDVTDPAHRNEMAERYEVVTAGGTAASIVGLLGELTGDEDAPDGEGVTSTDLGVEGFALLESEPEAVPTFGGVVALLDVPESDHRLTVNAAGTAPFSQRLVAGGESASPTGTPSATASPTGTATGTPTAATGGDGDVTLAGAGGQVSVVARSDAVKLELDEAADAAIEAMTVADDFGGPVYETRVDGREAVYVHEGGAYTADVRDTAGKPGAFRVNPDAGQERATIERPTTGKASLADYLVDLFADTRGTVRAGVDDPGSVEGLLNALSAVEDAAARAVEAARTGNPEAADRRLDTAIGRIEQVRSALADAAVPADTERAVALRSDIAAEKAEQARQTEL